MVNFGQVRPEDPGGPPWWKTISWKTNIQNFQYMAVLGQYIATSGQHWSSSAGGPPEDLPGGRPSAGKPKLYNENKCLTGLRIKTFGKIWSLFAEGPRTTPFAARQSTGRPTYK